MTLVKTLKSQAFENGAEIHSTQCYDKYSSTPRYEIVYSKPNWEYAKSIRAARTTWQKKFKEIASELERN